MTSWSWSCTVTADAIILISEPVSIFSDACEMFKLIDAYKLL